jgi:hypothetical protein
LFTSLLLPSHEKEYFHQTIPAPLLKCLENDPPSVWCGFKILLEMAYAHSQVHANEVVACDSTVKSMGYVSVRVFDEASGRCKILPASLPGWAGDDVGTGNSL